MFGEEQVCAEQERELHGMVLGQERELKATRSGGPSEGSRARARQSRFSRSSRAGLLFPVSRVERQLRSGRFAERFAARAPVYLAAVLQWVTRETMDVAGEISKQSKQRRISPSHLRMAMQQSSVLRQLLQGSVLRCPGRAVPRRQRVASPSKKKTSRRKKRCPRQRAAPARATAAVN